MREGKERESESKTFLLEPLLALTGSLTLTQTETVSNLHKCDIPTQLYLRGKLGIPEAILWLYGPVKDSHFNDDYDNENMINKIDGQMGLDSNSVQTLNSIQKLGWRLKNKKLKNDQRYAVGGHGHILCPYSDAAKP